MTPDLAAAVAGTGGGLWLVMLLLDTLRGADPVAGGVVIGDRDWWSNTEADAGRHARVTAPDPEPPDREPDEPTVTDGCLHWPACDPAPDTCCVVGCAACDPEGYDRMRTEAPW